MSMDHYNPLGVPRDADHDTIKKAYRKLAMQHHPDKGGDQAVCARVSAFYSQAMAKGMTASGANPDEKEQVDEDAVYRQQQKLAEPEWSAYKRAVSECSYCSTATYLEQRLLKGARWVVTRRERQLAFMREVDAADVHRGRRRDELRV